MHEDPFDQKITITGMKVWNFKTKVARKGLDQRMDC